MAYKKGFTLIEIITVLVIVGILAAVAVPAYTSIMDEGYAQAAYNNMKLIGNAEKNYFFTNGKYYINMPGNLSAINNALSLNISDTDFKYYIYDSSFWNQPGFSITAENSSGSCFMIYYSPPICPVGNPWCFNPSYCENFNPNQ